ncbi:MAG: DUF885 domain-containing protein [Candidatus Krumholzibacteriaceae bacterium]|jgi:uncharacterized protein (DUF885 family)
MSLHKRLAIRSVTLLVGCVILCAGCARERTEDARFEGLSKEFLKEYLRAHPSDATGVGEHRYDHELENMSRDAIGAEVVSFKSYLARLESVDETKLSRDNRIDAEVVKNAIRLELLEAEDVRSYETDPMLYTNLLGNSIYYLLARDFAPLGTRLDAAADRLVKFPAVIEQAMANLSNPPKISTETAISQNRGLMALVKNDLLQEAAKAPGASKKLEKAAGPALDALQRYQDFLEKDLVNRSLGEIRLGRPLYERLAACVLQTNMTPEEIVAAAYGEIDRVHDDMYELAAPLYARATGAKPLVNPSRADRIRIIKAVLDETAKDHPEPSGILDACKAAFVEASAFVREKDIVTIPAEPFEIVRAPEYSRGPSIAGLQAPGPLDRELKYYFFVSPVPEDLDREQTEEYLREYNNDMIRLVTIHEAMPGHFVQLAYGNRNPSIVRSVWGNDAFSEGWAVYCMELMTSLGFHGGDPRLKLQWEKFYLRTITNAIVDSGLHREGMTEKEAVKLLTEDGFQEEPEALIKWRRAGLSPAYLSTYFVGYQEIRALRREAEERAGSGFVLKDFHEKLLSLGALPPRLAREALFGQ